MSGSCWTRAGPGSRLIGQRRVRFTLDQGAGLLDVDDVRLELIRDTFAFGVGKLLARLDRRLGRRDRPPADRR